MCCWFCGVYFARYQYNPSANVHNRPNYRCQRSAMAVHRGTACPRRSCTHLFHLHGAKAEKRDYVSTLSRLSNPDRQGGARCRLSVAYDGEPVKTIHLTILRIRNSGNQPILPTDYIAPLSLYAQVGAKILSADIVAVSPHNLRAGISLKNGAAVADSVLLNPGDFFDVKILAQDGSEWMIVEGRLVGVQAIQRVLDPDSKLEFLSIIGMLALALGTMIQVSTRTPRLSIPTTLGENIGNFIAVSGVLVWISCTVLKFWRKRQTSDKK